MLIVIAHLMRGRLLNIDFSILQLLSMLWSLKKMLFLSVTIAISTLDHVQASEQGNFFQLLHKIILLNWCQLAFLSP